MSKFKNIKEALGSKTARRNLMITVGVIGGTLIYANMTALNQQSRPKELQAEIGTPTAPSVSTVPGTSTNPMHNQKIKDANQQGVQSALKTGDSAVPRLTNPTGDKEKDPFELMDKKNPNKPIDTAPVDVPRPVAPVEQQQQRPVQAVQKSQALIQSEQNMASAIAALLNSWTPAGQHVEVEYSANKSSRGLDSTSGNNGMNSATQVAINQTQSGVDNSNYAVSKKVDIKAGSVLNAVIITSVNSDEPGPVLALITTGPFAGGRLLGKFETPKDSDKMVLSFTTLSMKNADKSLSLSAYAINPETARTGLASNVDHHYLSRYGLFTAATFLKGYATALSQQGTTQTVSAGLGGLSTTTTYPTLSNRNVALTALGAVGSEVASSLKSNLNRPATVTLDAGTEIGLLIMKDASF